MLYFFIGEKYCIIYGAKKYDFAYERVLKTLRLALIISVAVAAVNFLLSSYSLRLFTNNSDVKFPTMLGIFQSGQLCLLVGTIKNGRVNVLFVKK